MKRRILRIIAALLVITSAALFVYPNISKSVVQKKNDEITKRFDEITEDVQEGSFEEAVENGEINEEGFPIDDEGEVISDTPVVFSLDLDRLLSDSQEYNDSLKQHQDMDTDFEDPVLDLSDYGIYDGVYGYITAPSIGLNVPIYLGADDSNMVYGCAHMTNTSLPIGGKNTNTVIAGHTGYFGRVVFDYIPNLEIGDTVSVTNYFDTIQYTVISLKEITSTETNDMYIEPYRDLLTLVTCSHRGKDRFEVICERI